MPSVCHLHVLVCHPYVTRMYSYIIRISLVCARILSVCHSYVIRMYSYVPVVVCTRMSSVCHSYVVLSWSDLMSSVCHSYIHACHLYVTCLWFYPEPLITSFSFLPLYELHCNFLCLYFGHVIKRGSIQDMIGFTLIFHTSLFFYRPADTTGVRGFVALNNSCEFSFNVQVSEIFWEFFKGSSRTQL